MLIDDIVRVNIKIKNLDKEYEVNFSKKLKLKENINLLLEMTNDKVDNFVVLLEDGTILDINATICELNLTNGTILFIYNIRNVYNK